MINWSIRRIGGCQPQPSHSMRPRPARTGQLPAGRLAESSAHSTRLIAIIPAHNEAANLASVVADVSARRPDLQVLVVDDGSTDSTAEVLDDLGVRWIRLPERMGVGCAMRAGLRCALRLGFDSAVRLDGDGQHGASDLETLLEPIQSGQAEVVLGSRYAAANSGRDLIYRFVRHPLAVCLTALTGRRITDPTSGFCAFGPRAVRLLADHHPSGYAEPELRLFLSRNGLRVVEVSVRQRARLNGRTSLTALRLLQAGARVMLAMLIVPLRAVVEEPARD
jgi:glycosyltransferase involved in cell wall biosynthesis